MVRRAISEALKQAFEASQHSHVIEQALRLAHLDRVPLAGAPLSDFVSGALRRVVACDASETAASAVVEELQWTLRAAMTRDPRVVVSGVHEAPQRGGRIDSPHQEDAPLRETPNDLMETLRPQAQRQITVQQAMASIRQSARPTLAAPPRVEDLRAICAGAAAQSEEQSGSLFAAMRFSRRSLPPVERSSDRPPSGKG